MAAGKGEQEKMRIDSAVIDEIKITHDLASYISSKGIKLKKNGKDFFGLCPFHKDSKPSLIVDPRKQLWNCLGACSSNGKSGGDIITFVMKYESCNFREAVAKLAPARPITIHPDIRRKTPALLSLVIDAYHRSFLESRSAQEYISSRGIDPALIKQYKAGYVDGSLLERVANDSADWQLLKELGIITESGNELMRGCIVFPLTAFNQFPVNLYGRSLSKDLHLYLPGPRRGLFNWNQAKNFEEIIFTESIIDALSFIQCGYLNVLPIYGTNGLIQEHIDFVVRFRSKEIILALDTDEAGKLAAEIIAKKFEPMHVPTRAIELPAKDANELLQREGVQRFKLIVDDVLKKEISSVLVEIPKQPEPYGQVLTDGEMIFQIEDRNYNIKGIPKKTFNRLRIAIKLAIGEANYLDSVDLLSARNRAAFAGRCASTFDLPKPILEKDLYFILDAIESYQKKTDQPEKPQKIELNELEKKEALHFLQSADLLDQITADMVVLGYVGEEANKKLGYLASISRFLEEPLSIVILSQSGSGKSYMAEMLEMLTPAEDLKMFSRLTPQALYYMEKDALAHKFVIIEERSGSAEADYSIRSLQSKKRLILAVPIKDPSTGKIQTTVFEIFGPTAFLETTTSSRINYENSTRCFEMYLDESAAQTEKIHQIQRFAKTWKGRTLQLQRQTLLSKHHNAQRLLRKLMVVIPYAEAIEFPASWLRTRRDHQRFLNLIEVIAFLHQYQKELKSDPKTGTHYIEADLRDYEIACKLAAEILPETLSDMKRPVAELLASIESYVEGQAKQQRLEKHEVGFIRRAIREETGLPNHRIKDLFHELEELEYLEVEKSARGGSFLYRLTDRKNVNKLSGLLSSEQLTKKLQQKW
jgi:DNA primase catalytic core